jgi:hypothetical protein
MRSGQPTFGGLEINGQEIQELSITGRLFRLVCKQ